MLSLLGALIGALAPAAPATAGQADGEVHEGLVYAQGPRGPLRLDVFEPDGGSEPHPTVLLVHGGAWLAGSRADFHDTARALADSGWLAVSIDYRLARFGEPSWPGAVTDVRRAVAWAGAHAADHGGTADEVALLGASAGAHLVAVVGAAGLEGEVGDAPAVESDATVGAVGLWSGPYELGGLQTQGDRRPPGCEGDPACNAFFSSSDVVRIFLGCPTTECPDRYAEASPLTHVDEASAPAYIVNAREEIVPEADARALADALEEAGVDHELRLVDGPRHGRQYADEVTGPTDQFLREHVLDEDEGGPPAWILVIAGTVAVVAAGVVLARRQ